MDVGDEERIPVPPVRHASQKGPNEFTQGGSKPLPIAPIQDEKKKKGFNKIFTSTGLDLLFRFVFFRFTLPGKV